MLSRVLVPPAAVRTFSYMVPDQEAQELASIFVEMDYPPNNAEAIVSLI